MTTRYEPARSSSLTSRTASPDCNGRRTVRHALLVFRLVPRARRCPRRWRSRSSGIRARPPLAVQAETVGFVIGTPLRHVHLHLPVTLEIHYWAFRRVDRQLMEVCGTEPGFLRVEIAEQTPLQERVVGEIDAGHDIRRAVGDLFGFRKEIIRVAIEHHASDDADREHFL